MTTTTTTTTATTTTTTMITTTTTYNVLARVPPRPRSCPVQPVQTQEQTKQPLPLNACADSYSTADMTTTAAMTTTTIKPTKNNNKRINKHTKTTEKHLLLDTQFVFLDIIQQFR